MSLTWDTEQVVFDKEVTPGAIDEAPDGRLRAHCLDCFKHAALGYMARDVMARYTIVRCHPPMLIDRKTQEQMPMPPYPADHEPRTCSCSECREARGYVLGLVRKTLSEEGWNV